MIFQTMGSFIIFLSLGVQAAPLCPSLFGSHSKVVPPESFFRSSPTANGFSTSYTIGLSPLKDLVSGHFPGNLILPGAFIAELGRQSIEINLNPQGLGSWELKEISKAKFTGIARPNLGESLTFHLKSLKTKSGEEQNWMIKATNHRQDVVMYSNFSFYRAPETPYSDYKREPWLNPHDLDKRQFISPEQFIPQKEGMILIDGLRNHNDSFFKGADILQSVKKGMVQDSIVTFRENNLFLESDPSGQGLRVTPPMLIEHVAQTAIGLISTRVNVDFSVLLTSVSTARFYASAPVGEPIATRVTAITDIKVESEAEGIYSMKFLGQVSTRTEGIAEIELSGRFQVAKGESN